MPGISVLISGIGIAGSTLAYWLGEHGLNPTLIERAPRLRTGGYIIDFWGLGFDVAERMGMAADLRSEGYNISELRLVNSKGKRTGGFGVDVFRILTGGRYVSLGRGDLAKLIYGKIGGRFETILDDSIASLEQDVDGVQVTFEHAPSRKFDLVVGADGLHSVVRKLAFGSEDEFEKYLGYTVAAFEVPGYQPRDELTYVAYAVPGKQVARFAMRGDRTLFLLIFAGEQSSYIDPRDTQAQKDILHAEFGHAGWECPQILAALNTCDELYFDRVSQIRMDTWTRGRVTLVGDSAFCPSLLAGQGSALAMIAAYVLAGEISKSEGSLPAALERYERLLHPFMTAKQTTAAAFAGSFAPKTRWGVFLRNQITRTFGIPFIAKLTMGRSFLDRIDLPEYPIQHPANPAGTPARFSKSTGLN